MAKSNFDYIICETALRLAAAQGWDKITFDALARSAKIPVAQIKKKYGSTKDILPLIADYITTQASKAAGKPDRRASPHDRLFEVMMARFDLLQTHRKAIRSIAAVVRRDPSLGVILAPAQIRGMKQALAFAGLGGAAVCPEFVPFALWGLYLIVFRIWQADETLDMSRTMAALDRTLRYAGQAATLLRVHSI